MKPTVFTAKAQEIIDALQRIDLAKPTLNKRVVEECLAEHLRLLKLPAMPMRWAPDAKSGYDYVVKKAEAARSAAESAAESAAWSAAWSAARSAAWSAAWSAARSAAWSAAESAAWSAARSAAWSAARSAAWSAARSAARSAAESAAESAARSAAWFNCSDKKAVTDMAGIWLPFLKARNAGLWLYWITADEIVCCAAPSLTLVANRLHNEDGPAVSWPSGESYYFYEGVQVTADIIAKRYAWEDIDAQTNSEVRRVMMTLYGTDRYVEDSGIKPVQTDEWGTLYRRGNKDGTVFMAVKVVNCTAESDGSFRDYWIRVNHKLYGGIKTAHAAIASTWRTKSGALAFARPEEYCPALES